MKMRTNLLMQPARTLLAAVIALSVLPVAARAEVAQDAASDEVIAEEVLDEDSSEAEVIAEEALDEGSSEAVAATQEEASSDAPTAEESQDNAVLEPAASADFKEDSDGALVVMSDGAGDSGSGIHELAVDEGVEISCDWDERWVARFTAGEAGVYRFWSESDNEWMTADLYADEDLMEYLRGNSASGADEDFIINCRLDAGQTVYLSVHHQWNYRFECTVKATYTGAKYLLNDCSLDDDLVFSGGYPAVASGTAPAVYGTNIDGEPLVEGRDFVIERFAWEDDDNNVHELSSAPTEPGHYIAYIDGRGDFIGTVVWYFDLVEPVDAVPITEGETIDVNASEADPYWVGSFTAPRTGRYAFVSVGDNGSYGWSAAVLADEGLSDVLASGIIYYDDIDYHVELEAGQTVYFKVWVHGQVTEGYETCHLQVYPQYDLSACRWEGTTTFTFDETTTYSSHGDLITLYDDSRGGMRVEDFYSTERIELEDGTPLDGNPTQAGTYYIVYKGLRSYYGELRVPLVLIDGTVADELTLGEILPVTRTYGDTWVGRFTAPAAGTYLFEAACGSNVEGQLYGNAALSDWLAGEWSGNLWTDSTESVSHASLYLSEGRTVYLKLRSDRDQGFSGSVRVRKGKDLWLSRLSLSTKMVIHTGEPQAPAVNNEYDLVEGTDYELSYADTDQRKLEGMPSDLGSYYVVCEGIGDYVGTVLLPFRIVDQHDLTSGTMTLDHDDSQPYVTDGTPVKVTVTVYSAMETELRLDSDYSLHFEDEGRNRLSGAPSSAGTYYVVAEGMGDYEGTLDQAFEVVDALDLANARAEQARPLEANGEPVSGVARIVDALGNELIEGEHYRAISYSSWNSGEVTDEAPSAVGHYSVTYEGIDPYFGRCELAFSIIELAPRVDLVLGDCVSAEMTPYVVGIFTAPIDDHYILYDSGGGDTLGELYADATLATLLGSDDDSGSNGHSFRIEADLTAGQTVYLRVHRYDERSGSTSIYVKNDRYLSELQWTKVGTSDTRFTYNGQPQVPQPLVCDKSGRYLVAGEDFVLARVCEKGTDENGHVVYKELEDNPTDIGNYRATYEGKGPYLGTHDVDFEIRRRSVTVKSVNATKTYGMTDPELTVDCGGRLVEGDELSYTLTREPGEDVGSYAISVSGERYQGNYDLSFFSTGRFTVTPATAVVRAQAATKAYGDPDPEMARVEGLVGNDTVDFEVTREPGEDVGTYAIMVSGASKQGNYTVSYEGDAALSITKAASALTAAASKTQLATTYNPSASVTTAANTTVRSAVGAVTYTNVSTDATAKGFVVDTVTGKVTLPKGTRAKTYTVAVKASDAGDANHMAGAATVSYKIVVGKAANTLTAAATKTSLSTTYNASKAQVTAANVTVKGAVGSLTYANASTDATAKRFTVTASGTSAGKVSVPKGTKAGTYNVAIKVKAAGNTNYQSASKIVTYKIVVNKAANPMSIKAVTKTASVTKLKSNAVTVARPMDISKAQGKLTYVKASGSSALTVNKTTGKVTVKKGTKKGTYSIKIKVTAAGNTNYKKATKTVSCKVVVK